MKHFHERLKHIRKINGHTQKFIADKLNINQSKYAKYEDGTNEPGLSLINCLIQLYSINPKWILFGFDEIHDQNISKDIAAFIECEDSSNESHSALFLISYDDLDLAVKKNKINVSKEGRSVCINVLISTYLDYQENLVEIVQLKSTSFIIVETFCSSHFTFLKNFLEISDIEYALG